jgi:putative endonuclease
VIPLSGKQDPRRSTGRIGEAWARRFLESRGWEILDANWRVRWGELDIVALRDNQLIVVEVRTTRGTRFGYGYESVDFRKRQQVRRLALRYLQEKGLFHLPVRFDVISVLLGEDDRPKSIRHLEGAF